MTYMTDIQDPVIHWLNKRSQYVKGSKNWDWVLRDPVVGHLAPTLFLLEKKGIITLSEKIRNECGQQYWQNKARWIIIENQLKNVLGLFKQAHVPVIPLKGAILQRLVYKDIGLRSISDIDLLVQRNNFLLMAKLLIQHGMTHIQIGNSERLTELEKYPEKFLPGELTFQDGQGLMIDLHQNLVTYLWFNPAYPLDIVALWDRRIILSDEEQSLELFGDGLWNTTLSPYDMLAHMCLHLALHGMRAMKSYLDVDLWLRSLSHDWDWEKFIELTNQWQIRSAVYHVFLYCITFMGSPIPESLLKRFDPGWSARFRVKILLSSRSILSDRPSLGKRYPGLVKLAIIDHLSILFVTLFKIGFPEKAWRELNPSRRSIFAHLLHIFKVVERGD